VYLGAPSLPFPFLPFPFLPFPYLPFLPFPYLSHVFFHSFETSKGHPVTLRFNPIPNNLWMDRMNNVHDIDYNGQALQDKFVLSVLKHKHNGYFLELGANHPSEISNTYVLETKYGWKGIMVEYDNQFRDMYTHVRPNSYHVFEDAACIDYAALLSDANFPENIDFLQIDLEPSNGSTLSTLMNLDEHVMDKYKFATITFEHDIYMNQPIFHTTREMSRNIFEKRGYIRLFGDVTNDGHWDSEANRTRLIHGETVPIVSYEGHHPFEDWYVHPELVDMEYVNHILEKNRNNRVSHPITGNVINCFKIEY